MRCASKLASYAELFFDLLLVISDSVSDCLENLEGLGGRLAMVGCTWGAGNCDGDGQTASHNCTEKTYPSQAREIRAAVPCEALDVTIEVCRMRWMMGLGLGVVAPVELQERPLREGDSGQAIVECR